MGFARNRSVWTSALVLAGLAAVEVASRSNTPVGVQPDGRVFVPNGQALTPAGEHVEVNDRPLGMVVSPNGKLLAVVTGSNFAPRALHLIDVAAKTLKQTIPIANSFVGVAFSPAGDRIYVGGGASNDVKIFASGATGTFAAAGTIPISGGSAPSGLSLSPDGNRLYVALNMTHEVAVIDTTTNTIVRRVPVGIYPYTTVTSGDGGKVYVSNWGGKVPGPSDTTDGMFPVVVDPRTGIPATGTVSVIETSTNTVVRTIDVGLHPTGMAISPSGDRLYVTNANSDTVSVVATATDTVAKTLHVGQLGPGRVPVLGSSPNAVTVSPDGDAIYVANATENAVAVVDPDTSAANAVRGLIPTGWFPTAVALDATGGELFIASGYGFGSIAPLASGTGRSYTDRVGVVSVLNVPGPGELGQFTAQVKKNNAILPPDGVDHAGGSNPIPMHVGQGSPIKHVFYIIKENRTYDQVFGDMPQGNGDPSLVEFGRDVTPNHHALAE